MAVFISHKKIKKIDKGHLPEASQGMSNYLIGTCLTRPHEIIDRFGFKTGIFIFRDSTGEHYLIHCPGYLAKLLGEYPLNDQKIKIILSQSSLNKSAHREHLRAINLVLL